MNAAIYQHYRDELLGLLDQGASALDFSMSDNSLAEPRKALYERKRKLQENEFSLLLVADFQGGKSTVFNAMACDGREFSPVGSNIRTSACLVTAQPLADRAEPEHAIIKWKTDGELISGFDERLLPHLQKLAPARFSTTKDAAGNEMPPRVATLLNLRKDKDLDLLGQAALMEIAVWNSNRRIYDPLTKGFLDVARFALIVSHFYKHEEIRRLQERSGNRFTPEECSQLVRYPKKWEHRWSLGDPSQFSWEEITFAFVRAIHLHLHSVPLARIGCQLVDSPGLFASSYDTAVARSAIQTTDAILYLCPGEKAVSLNSLNELLALLRSHGENRLFIGWNLRTSEKNAVEELLPDLIGKIEASGFHIHKEDCFLIHAALALTARQLQLGQENRLGDLTANAIATRFGKSPKQVQDLLWDLIARYRATIKDDAITPESKDAKTIAEARQESHLDEMIAAAESYVVKNRGRFVLIDNGAMEVVRQLQVLEGALQSKEAAALAEWERRKADYSLAEKQLQEFRDQALKSLERLEETTADCSFGYDLEKLFDEALRQTIVRRAAEAVSKGIGFWEVVGGLWDKVTGNPAFKNIINQTVVPVFNEECEAVVDQWYSGVVHGRNENYRKTIGRFVETASQAIRQDWEKVSKGTAMLEGIKLPPTSPLFKEAAELMVSLMDAQTRDELVRNAANLAAGAALVASGSVAVAIALILGHSVTTFLGFALWTTVQPWMWPVLIGGIIATLAGVPFFMTNARAKLEKAIDKALGDGWNQLRKEFHGHGAEVAKNIREEYLKHFKTQIIPLPAREYERRKTQELLLMKESRERREAAATEAREVRVNRIAPLRQALEEFCTRCAAAFPTPAPSCLSKRS